MAIRAVQGGGRIKRLRATQGGVVAGPSLPQSGSVVAHWSADGIAPLPDNTAIGTSWTDSVGGFTFSQATSANQPKYRTNALGTKPGLQFTGSSWMNGLMPSLKTVIDSKTYTVYILVSAVQVRSNGSIFSNSAGGNSFNFQGTGALIGRFNAPTLELRAPWTDTASAISMGYTSSATKPYPSQSGTALERCYFNGMCATSNAGVGPGTSAADGSFSVGALNATGTQPSQCYVYEIIVWNRVLTPAENAQAEVWARSKYSQAVPWASLPRMFHFDGDSLTVGVGTPSIASSYPYQVAQSLGLAYGQWAMHAVGGLTTQDMSGNAGSTAKINDFLNLVTYTGVTGRVLAFEWYNEKNTGRTAQAYSDMVTYCSTVKAAQVGLKLCLGSSTGYTGDATDPYATVRGAYNALLDANNGSMADSYVPIHNDPTIGDGNSYANNSATDWAGDGVHLNATGRAVLAGLMLTGAQAINN